MSKLDYRSIFETLTTVDSLGNALILPYIIQFLSFPKTIRCTLPMHDLWLFSALMCAECHQDSHPNSQYLDMVGRFLKKVPSIFSIHQASNHWQIASDLCYPKISTSTSIIIENYRKTFINPLNPMSDINTWEIFH